MKILIIKMNIPYPPDSGTRKLTYNLIRNLSKKHEVTLVTLLQKREELAYVRKLESLCKVEWVFAPNKHSLFRRIAYRLRNTFIAVFTTVPIRVLYYNPPIVKRRIKRLLAEEEFDVVQMDYWYTGRYTDLVGDARTILYCHDVEYVTNKRHYRTRKNPLEKIDWYFRWKKEKRYEIRMFRKADAIFTVTENDGRIVRSHLPSGGHVYTIPTDIDTTGYKFSHDRVEENHLVFVGAMYAHFNADAVLYFADTILPLIRNRMKDVRFTVVGMDPPKEVMKLGQVSWITVTGYVEDVLPYLERGAVYVAPIRVGSGIKIKLLEAMAMGKAVVTTSIGAEGLAVNDGEHCLIADAPEEFAMKTIALLQDRKMRERLGKNARALIDTVYSSKQAERRIFDIYEKGIWNTK